jgi:molecular chaperone GrpE
MSEDHTPDAADEFLADAAEAEIAALKAEAAGLKEQALRYAAEAENTTRRAEREAIDARAYAIQ